MIEPMTAVIVPIVSIEPSASSLAGEAISLTWGKATSKSGETLSSEEGIPAFLQICSACFSIAGFTYFVEPNRDHFLL